MRWTTAAVLLACAAAAPRSAEAQSDTVAVCVVRDDGELGQELHTFDRANPPAHHHSHNPDPGPGYAAGKRWFIDNEPFRFNDRGFVKYGLPLVVELGKLKRVGRYRGVGLYTEVEEGDDPLVLYVPVRPGCEFQRYQTEPIGRVRG